MSEYRAPETHRPFSRLALPLAGIAAAVLLAGCGKQENKVDPELTASLIAPVAKVEMHMEKVAPGNRTGEQIYKNVCSTCHAAGLLNAPKTGDAGAWKPRLALGHDGLTASAIAGKNAMPPRGGGNDLTDTEVKRAVAFLANQAGASFTEPPLAQ